MFGDILRNLRKRRKISQAELAEAIGMSQATVASWENGTRKPDINGITKLSLYFNISTDQLLGVMQEDGGSKDDRELWEAREAARRDPDRLALFMLAKNGSAKDVRQVVALIDALRATNPDFYDGDDPS